MGYDVTDLPTEVLAFLQEPVLASLSLWLPPTEPGDAAGRHLHVSAVGFSWDTEVPLARVITFAAAAKVRLLDRHGSLPAALCQVDGGRWLALHGTATVSDDPAVNADAERRYAARYRPPGDRGIDRRTIEVAVDAIVGRA